MKKIIFIIICLIMLPVMVNAKEYCEVIKSGDKGIGSEVKCGSEYFYVVSNANDQVQMLAKYNLFVGDKIDVINVTDNPTINGSYEDYCFDLAESKNYDPYYVYGMEDNDGNLTSCRVYEKINYDRVKQDSRAIGTKLVDGKSVLPLYGIVYMNPNWGYERMVDGEWYDFAYTNAGNLDVETTPFVKYLDGYKDELEDQGIDVSKVQFITFNKTINLLERIYGSDIEVELEYDDDAEDAIGYYTGKMDITNYVGSNDWIYGTTYWLGSGFEGDGYNPHEDVANDYYISNEGMLCAIGKGVCIYLPYPIGNGIRPLVTIPSDSIKYAIATETDGNGSIEVVSVAAGDETIQFRVNAKKGYKLSTLIVTTDSGETVEFNEGQITTNKDGTISIDKNVFKMPFENVTIQARFTTDNPKTGRSLIVIVILSLLTIGTSVYVYRKNNA